MTSNYESTISNESLAGKRFTDFVLAHTEPVSSKDSFDTSRMGTYSIDYPDSLIPCNAVVFDEIMTLYSTGEENGRAFNINFLYIGELYTENLYTVTYTTDFRWQNQPFVATVCGDTVVEGDSELLAQKLIDNLIELEEKGLLVLKV
jgi:hypothetical protein